MDMGKGGAIVARLIHELWEDTEEGTSMVCLAGQRGEGARSLLSSNARLTWTFEAESHYEAMTVYYSHMGWGEYATDQEQDFQPYPDEWSERN
jgi:hypothetical protein